MVETTRIVFVDDELKVIRGLARSLRMMVSDWDMVFCQSGQEALIAMEQQPADIIVTDMRMPGMEGAELLDVVRKKYPDTIRVILSGYAEKDCVFRTVGPAHVYLAKPCDAQVLHDTLLRPMVMRRVLNGNELRQMLGGMTHLPSVPDVFVQLQQELASPQKSAASIANIIRRDIGMTTELLKLTNSAYFAIGAKITSPLGVLNLLGIDLVQSLILKIGIFRQFSGKPSLVKSIEALSTYSLRLGQLAEAFATAAGSSPAEAKAAQCAAMLSPLGCLILLDQRTADYEALLPTVGPAMSLDAAEKARFGVDHSMIGAYLLSLWGFSDLLVEAVAFARNPSACLSEKNPILAIIHAALALGPSFPLLPEGSAPPQLLNMKYLMEARYDKYVRRWTELAAQTEGK